MTNQQFLEKFEEIVALQLNPVKQQLQTQSTDIKTLKKDMTGIKDSMAEVRITVTGVQDTVTGIQDTVAEHTKDIKKIKRKLNKTAKDIHVAIGLFDERINHNTHSIEEIRQHIGRPS